jgi:hypothetical protein
MNKEKHMAPIFIACDDIALEHRHITPGLMLTSDELAALLAECDHIKVVLCRTPQIAGVWQSVLTNPNQPRGRRATDRLGD